MSTYHDKALERLVYTLTKLSNNELPTVEELAEEFNVTVRTIQRDLNRLKYFPIEKDAYKRLKFTGGYSLSKSTLEDNELLVTHLALSQLKNINKEFDENIDRVISKVLYPGYNCIFHIKPESYEKIDSNSKINTNLENAIENKYISIVSISSKIFYVEPYKIINLEGIWYLLAFDKEIKKIKSFLLSKIENVKLTTKKFKATKSINKIIENVHSGFFEDGCSFEVVIKVYHQVSHYFKIKNFLPTQKIIKEQEDKSLIISFKVTHYEDIDNIIKSWIPHIEVLKPTEYKEQVIAELEDYISKLTRQNTYELQESQLL